MKLLVGIDVSSEKLDLCFLDSEDQLLLSVSLPNTIVGAYQIKEWNCQYQFSRNQQGIIKHPSRMKITIG